ncbi:MAG TPA: TetR/AcrR family transcriptional regulator [Terracidiphilus sp.]|nr:TetR/AcrR family transcriptional regulator [Terracidiphilus sp.]
MTTGAEKREGGAAPKVAITPQRSNGRARVALILEAAADVIRERGYESTTMSEIALRSGTKIGSLYRFFPTKELVGDALIEDYAQSSEVQWQAIIAAAPGATPERLADLLLDAYIEARKKHSARALLALLEGRADGSRRREEFRHRNLERIGEALKANAPHLRAPTLRKMAVVMLYHMRAMMAMTFDPNAPNAPGAPEELRISVRSWLAARLLPHNANPKRKET